MSAFGPDYRWLSATTRELAGEAEEARAMRKVAQLLLMNERLTGYFLIEEAQHAARVRGVLARRAPWRREQRR